MSTIGERIRELRHARTPRVTQAGLAERAGVSIELVKKLEQGAKHTARVTTLSQIARALDVSLSALLDKQTTHQGLAAVPWVPGFGETSGS